MRTEDNKAIPPQDFLLRKGTTHDFGRNTIQLKDNWRMVSHCHLQMHSGGADDVKYRMKN